MTGITQHHHWSPEPPNSIEIWSGETYSHIYVNQETRFSYVRSDRVHRREVQPQAELLIELGPEDVVHIPYDSITIHLPATPAEEASWGIRKPEDW